MKMECGSCVHRDTFSGLCCNSDSKRHGTRTKADDAPCIEYSETLCELREEEKPAKSGQKKTGAMMAMPAGPENLEEVMAVLPMAKVPALQESADALAANVQQMGKYLLQMGQMLGAMQKRMDELEARQKAVTISHAEVKQLNARIRKRAYDWCTRYRLIDEECAKKARAAIKKDVLRMNQVRDLHDLPAAMLAAVQQQIDDWTDFRLVMELRKAART